ncbi:MAG TPA: tetratricopeptide repeat protein [Ferruginibacter sp.]|nr:tetratricopeptide repeat protein [Ferruginibacter sp.]
MLKPVVTFFSLLFILSTSNAQLQNKAVIFYNRGIEYKNKKMIVEAIQSFKAAINANKKYDSAYMQLGELYMMSGKYNDALAIYKKAISINPKITEALINAGKIYRYYRSNTDSALYFFKTATVYSTANEDVFNNISWCYNTKMKYDSAIVYGIKALEVNNNYRTAYGELAYAYRQSGRFADAIIQFKKNLSISIVDLAFLYSGYCYVELKDKTGAMQQYEELLKINTKMAVALKKAIDKME